MIRRIALAVPALVLVGVLAGCSGDDEVTGFESLDTPSSTPTATPAFPLVEGDDCPASVVVSGAADQQWDATGTVVLADSAPQATYQSADGATVLTAYAGGKGFEQTFVLAVGTDTYAPNPGDPGLDVAADGAGASIDADASTPDGATVHVTASFAC